MPTVFLLCGLPGSGKTTLARQIERERRAIRLASDEWIRGKPRPDLLRSRRTLAVATASTVARVTLGQWDSMAPLDSSS